MEENSAENADPWNEPFSGFSPNDDPDTDFYGFSPILPEKGSKSLGKSYKAKNTGLSSLEQLQSTYCGADIEEMLTKSILPTMNATDEMRLLNKVAYYFPKGKLSSGPSQSPKKRDSKANDAPDDKKKRTSLAGLKKVTKVSTKSPAQTSRTKSNEIPEPKIQKTGNSSEQGEHSIVKKMGADSTMVDTQELESSTLKRGGLSERKVKDALQVVDTPVGESQTTHEHPKLAKKARLKRKIGTSIFDTSQNDELEKTAKQGKETEEGEVTNVVVMPISEVIPEKQQQPKRARKHSKQGESLNEKKIDSLETTETTTNESKNELEDDSQIVTSEKVIPEKQKLPKKSRRGSNLGETSVSKKKKVETEATKADSAEIDDDKDRQVEQDMDKPQDNDFSPIQGGRRPSRDNIAKRLELKVEKIDENKHISNETVAVGNLSGKAADERNAEECPRESEDSTAASEETHTAKSAALDPKMQPILKITPLKNLDEYKSLQNSSGIEQPPTPTLEHAVEDPVDISANDAYFAPFSYGWKRELYFMQGRVTVVYIHPLGLRLRDMEDVSQHLTDGLTLENFTFVPEPLGADVLHEQTVPEPKIENIVREETKVEASSPTQPTVRKSGRIPVPSSSYKLQKDYEDAPVSRKLNPDRAPKKEKLVLKIKPYPPTPGVAPTTTPATPLKPFNSTPDLKTPTPEKKTKKTNKRGKKSIEPPSQPGNMNCPMKCALAETQAPSLQCSVCLCMYHPECVGASAVNKYNYICQNCRPSKEKKPAEAAASAVVTPTTPASAQSTTPQEAAPFPFPFPPAPAVPQFFITLPDGRKFIVVPNMAQTPAEAPPQTNEAPLVKKQPERKGKEPDGAAMGPLGVACNSFSVFLHVFKFLPIPDRLRCAQVCRFTRMLCMEPSLWERIKICHPISNWNTFSAALSRGATKQLDLTEMPSNYSVEQWQNISKILASVPSLETILMPTIPAPCCLSLMRCSGLRAFQCEIGPLGGTLSLTATENPKIEELKIKGSELGRMNALQISALKDSLKRLSLLRWRCDWKNVCVESLKEMANLTELEFGECSSLPANFPSCLLPLQNLTRVRLEACNKTCPTLEIMNALASLPLLRALELINFDAPQEIELALAEMTSLQDLLLVPQFDNQSATKASSVLKGLYQLKDTLLRLALVFTLECLQVTDNNMASTKKKKRGSATSESCIPMLLPIALPANTNHHAHPWRDILGRHSADSSFAPLSLTDLQLMLNAALPTARTIVSKTPYSQAADLTMQSLFC